MNNKESEALDRLVNSDPDLAEAAEALSKIEIGFGQDAEKIEAARRDTWSRITPYISATGKVRRLSRRITGVAASVAAVLVAGFITFLLLQNNTAMVIVANDSSDPMEVLLEDNTRIWLHWGAEISYPEKFSGKERPVTLSGEAFFDVESDGKRPFRVKTADVEVVVLGTRFNVMANTDDPVTEIMLESGSIALKQPGKKGQTMVSPGELAVVERSDASVTISKADPYLHSVWKESELVFRSQQLGTIFMMLGKAYDVDIRLDNEALANTIYTGRFKKTTPIGEVLAIIQMNTQIEYKIGSDEIIIR